LGPYFEQIIVEEEFGRGKPHPEVYEALFTALGTKAREAWFVGDNLDFDVQAPQSLGAYAIWIDRAGGGLPPQSAVRPDRIVRSIAELRA
jgi:putative hydrolase of the HAD superfamily